MKTLSRATQHYERPDSIPDTKLRSAIKNLEGVATIIHKQWLRLQLLCFGVSLLLTILYREGKSFAGLTFFLFLFFIMFYTPLGIALKVRSNFKEKPFLEEYCSAVENIEVIASDCIDISMGKRWAEPPAFLAIDLNNKTLFVESPETNYTAWILPGNCISDVKVEREIEEHTKTTVNTETTHGGRATFSITNMNSSGIGSTVGWIGGGKSRSKSTSNSVSKSVENAFLELCFLPDTNEPAIRLIFPFGSDRKGADDWALAIRRIAT